MTDVGFYFITDPFFITIYMFNRYMVYMDENGDAEGNYTLIALDDSADKTPGLYPIAHFVGKEENTNLPVNIIFLASNTFLSFFSSYYFVEYCKNIFNVLGGTNLSVKIILFGTHCK